MKMMMISISMPIIQRCHWIFCDAACAGGGGVKNDSIIQTRDVENENRYHSHQTITIEYMWYAVLPIEPTALIFGGAHAIYNGPIPPTHHVSVFVRAWSDLMNWMAFVWGGGRGGRKRKRNCYSESPILFPCSISIHADTHTHANTAARMKKSYPLNRVRKANTNWSGWWFCFDEYACVMNLNK